MTFATRHRLINRSTLALAFLALAFLAVFRPDLPVEEVAFRAAAALVIIHGMRIVAILRFCDESEADW